MLRSACDLLKLVCLVVACGQLETATVDLLQWSSRCCVKGERKVMGNPSTPAICESDDLDRRTMDRLTRLICRHAERGCCVRELMKSAAAKNCELGKYHAYQGRSCAQVDGHTSQLCCSCCNLGIKARSLGVTRDWLIQSEPCDSAFKDCLQGDVTGAPPVATVEATTAPPTTVTALTTCDEASCQHVCQFSDVTGAVCFCRTGYMIHSDGRSCTDVNECAYPNTCAANHVCHNTPGSYVCRPTSATCEVGRERVNGNCQDIDECSRRSAVCGSLQTCSNTDGSYKCNCISGYEPIPGSSKGCRDIDECSSGRASCGSLQSCVNTRGSYQCRCNRGFEAVPGSTRSCRDIDECARFSNLCSAGLVCKNDAGSYQCVPAVTCGVGRENRNGRCIDIDECSTGKATCGSQQECTNTDGSYACRCKTGYEPVPGSTRDCRVISGNVCNANTCPRGTTCRELGNRQHRCEDIDECQENPSRCSTNEQCRNTIGSYSCECLAGYARNPTTRACEVPSPCTRVRCRAGFKCVAVSQRQYRCEDIDECSQTPSLCKPEEECVNYAGYYYCRCPTGYEKKGGRCVDRDECRANVCQHTCTNTEGSFVCSCRSGFRKAGRSCIDIDECKNSICDHRCSNSYGSYRCYCNRGYTLASDEHTCTDNNECDRKGVCMYQCQNTPGSYRCTCPPGYRTFRYACQDIDECATPGTCSDNKTYCFNIYGGSRCLPKVICSEFYEKTYGNKCQKRCPDERNERCEAIVEKSYAQYAYNLRSETKPFVLFSYQIFIAGDSNSYLVRYTFSSGNEEGAFEIRNLANYKAEVLQTHPIVGPKSYRLSFDGEVIDNGKVISRYVNHLYVFVSAHTI